MKKFDVLKDIFDIENTHSKLLSLGIDPNELLRVLALPSYNLSQDLGFSHTKISNMIKKVWVGKPTGNSRICTFLLHKYNMKYCTNCKEVHLVDAFSNNKARPDGFNNHCRVCCLETRREYQKQYQSTVRAEKLNRTVSWADHVKIKEIYDNCPTDHHVDHIIPLQGKLVSGLHVEYNLQYLTAKDNLTKHNSFIIE